MIKKCKQNISRGLAIALLIQAQMAGNCLAATSNELRTSIGLKQNSYSQTSDYISDNNKASNSDSEANESDSNNQSISQDDSQYSSLIEQASNSDRIKKYKKDIDDLNNKLNQQIKSKSTAFLLTVTVDGIIKDMDSLSKIDRKDETEQTSNDAYTNTNVTDTIDGEKFSYDDVIKSSFSDNSNNEITAENFSIGDIGESSISVVSKYLKIVRPWGFNKRATDEKYDNKLLGVELYAKPEDLICSQWNGIVVDIIDDAYGSKQIRIYHGNSTYTLYNNVYPLSEIKVGTRVYQGENIAKAADTSKIASDRDNFIYYQIRLNGHYINPILIYGNRGKQLYEDWLKSNDYDNLIEKGEKYYNDADETWEVKNLNTPDSVLYPDFNKNS